MTTPSSDAEHRVLDVTFARDWIADFVDSFATQVQVISELDRRAGDGDFGTNLTSALSRANGFIDELKPSTFSEVLHAVSKGFLNTGGTSGPLFGMWFRETAKATSAEPTEVTALAAGVESGLAVIQRLAGAQVGDSTMVDAITPAAAALSAAGGAGQDLVAALLAAADAARAGAESTRDLIASRGRASYVGEVARGVLDPGAVAVAILFASAVTVATGDKPDLSWLTD